jgi:hypothetical protein
MVMTSDSPAVEQRLHPTAAEAERGREPRYISRTSEEFWSAPAEPWTSVKAWSGKPFPIDHALGT